MKTIMVVLMSVLILGGCGNNLNKFEYADLAQQASVMFIEECTSSYFDNYCKVLSNGDIVYFDTRFDGQVIINPGDEVEQQVKEILVGIHGDDYTPISDTDPIEIKWITDSIKSIKKDMRKHGLGDNAIYVIQDGNGDLVFRMTNSKVDYNYFATDEAVKLYEEYQADK